MEADTQERGSETQSGQPGLALPAVRSDFSVKLKAATPCYGFT